MTDIIIKKFNEIIKNILKENKVLAVTTIFIMLVQTIFYNSIKEINSKYIILFAFINQLLLLYSLYKKNHFIKEISHLGFGATIILILLFSKNKILNNINICILIYTIISRKIYDGCMFFNCNSGDSVNFFPEINYDLLYSTLFLIQSFKNVYYFF